MKVLSLEDNISSILIKDGSAKSAHRKSNRK